MLATGLKNKCGGDSFASSSVGKIQTNTAVQTLREDAELMCLVMIQAAADAAGRVQRNGLDESLKTGLLAVLHPDRIHPHVVIKSMTRILKVLFHELILDEL